ncbi:initiation-specific alpha-1,6-mannosyltransferase [Colletotrichum truncatum]|uniref:Initiation-specific alpha-1,6-mannosyltransferase n=1 Tax=Colletotrichum truncatum TaxID=5467 RepID=A0ACC3YC66_COLTU|nr:initiation-specific alpha-1,6-mannosyltransferase [Colletotrichum truncatum]KAF6793953.1 initiation-specific alpha-1,6-mannosyltransferase [Colletotrichum truncatum]
MAAMFRDGVSSMTLLQQRTYRFLQWLRCRLRGLTKSLSILLSVLWLHNTLSIRSNIPQLKNDRCIMKHSILGDNPAQSDWVKPNKGNIIPRKIWQIILSRDGTKNTPVSSTKLKGTAMWLALNVDYTYMLLGDTGSEYFIERCFTYDPIVQSTYNSLPNVAMKSDFLRYLLLSVEGGIYADTDTVALKSIDQWVPYRFRGLARLVVGIEFDQGEGTIWSDMLHPLQFCQWTIAAAPGHPVFQKMTARIARSTAEIAEENKVKGIKSTWKPTSLEVMNSTGPAAWTDVVWEYLQEVDKDLTDIRNLSHLETPRLYGDVLILPIDGFGMGQLHSGSTNDGSIPDSALVKHLFEGSWREDTARFKI